MEDSDDIDDMSTDEMSAGLEEEPDDDPLDELLHEPVDDIEEDLDPFGVQELTRPSGNYVSSMTSAQSVAGPAPPSTEQASTSSHLSTGAVAATNEQQNLLQSKVMVAVRRGYIGVLDHIKKSLQKDFNFSFRHNLIKDTKSRKVKYTTPLLCACKCNQQRVMEWLLPKVNTKETTKIKETALITVVSNREINMEMIRSLLKDGDQNLGDVKKHKMTALHIACQRGYVEVVQLLLDYDSAWRALGHKPPKTLDRDQLGEKNGNTPFMLAVSKNTVNHRVIVNTWLEKEGAAVCRHMNKRKFNAAMIAAHNGHLDYLKMMEACGGIADEIAEMKTTCGWNIIHCAVASGSLELLKWLLEAKSSVLLKTEILDAQNTKGYTPFLLACEYQKVQVVKYLVELSTKDEEIVIDINAKTSKGMTALHLAAMHDATDIVDFLLDYEIDIQAKEAKNGNTVLHIATSKSSNGVESRLKEEAEYEALKDILNKFEKTAEGTREPVHIPLEIKKRGEKSIKAYRNALREGKTKNNHCNLVVLGEERVGKTSLIKGLLGYEFDPDCKSTQGIQIDQIQTVAERVDIVLRNDPLAKDQPGVWEAVNPKERVNDHFAESVAQAVTEAGPELPETDDEFENIDDVPEEDLMAEVEELVKKLKPALLEQRRLKPKKKKKTPRDSETQQKRKKPAKPSALNGGETEPSNPEATYQQQHAAHGISRGSDVQQPEAEANSEHIVHETTADLGTPLSSARESSISYSDSKVIARKLKQNAKNQRKKLIFHAIDFAGQSLYRPMHHCFITHRAVYIVVFKLTELLRHIRGEQLDKDPFLEIQYWLNNIIAHASVSSKEENSAKIFLVGTHKNGDPVGKVENPMGPLTDDEIEEINQKLMEKFVINDTRMKYCNFIQFTSSKGGNIVFCIENSLTSKHNERRSESGIHQLTNRIDEIREEITFLSEDFPTSYIKFEQKLLEMQEKRKGQPLSTSREEVEGWAMECGITDLTGIETAIQFYHDIRVIVDQGLILSPFRIHQPNSPKSKLVFLSPQWLGDVMCKIVELKIGNKQHNINRMRSFIKTGIMLKSDLQRCLLEKDNLDGEVGPFTNLLKILHSYCLIFRLTKKLHRLLSEHDEFDVAEGEDVFLVPCRMPAAAKKPCKFPKACYKFEFHFEGSYLPQEVYVHCLCVFLSKAELTQGDEEKRKQKLQLSESSSTFSYFRLEKNYPLADWKIEMDKEQQALIFSVCPHVHNIYRNWIVDVDDCVVNFVCDRGSLGRLAYKGGPRVNCTCCTESDETVTLPYVRFSPDEEFPSPDTPMCRCECDHKEFNVDEILKQQMFPVDSSSSGTGQPTIQNTIIQIGNTAEPVVTPTSTTSATSQVATSQQPASASSPLASSDDQVISSFKMTKIAEVFHDEGKRLARYLEMKKEWRKIESEPPEDEEDDEEDIAIEKVKKLLKKWLYMAKDSGVDAKAALRDALQEIDPDKATRAGF